MSEYVKVSVKFKDKDALVEALKACGFTPEVYEEAQPLIDWQGKARQTKAQIIVRRKQLETASNDMGFEWAADGYKVHISDYDVQGSRNKLPKIKQEYTIAATTVAAKKRGWSVQKELQKDGTVKLRIRGVK